MMPAARFANYQFRLIYNMLMLVSGGVIGFVQQQFGGGAAQFVLGLGELHGLSELRLLAQHTATTTFMPHSPQLAGWDEAAQRLQEIRVQ